VLLDDLGVGPLPGVPFDDGRQPPGTVEEARAAGAAAARLGVALEELIYTGVLRYPGDARGICRLIAAAVEGWHGELNAAGTE
jgi:hypothetical protein